MTKEATLTREELEEQMREFKRNKGKIQKIPVGFSNQFQSGPTGPKTRAQRVIDRARSKRNSKAGRKGGLQRVANVKAASKK